jgi:hypothetical protein
MDGCILFLKCCVSAGSEVVWNDEHRHWYCDGQSLGYIYKSLSCLTDESCVSSLSTTRST